MRPSFFVSAGTLWCLLGHAVSALPLTSRSFLVRPNHQIGVHPLQNHYCEAALSALFHQAKEKYGEALRPAVSVVITGNDGRVLMARRRNSGKYGTPGGGVDPTDPSFRAAIEREGLEEGGFLFRNLLPVLHQVTYDYEKHHYFFVVVFRGEIAEITDYRRPQDKDLRWHFVNPKEIAPQLFEPNEFLLHEEFLRLFQ